MVCSVAFFCIGSFFGAHAQDNTLDKMALHAQLKEVANQITQLESDITNAKKDTKSFQQEMYIFNQEIEKKNLHIKEINLHLQEAQEELSLKNKEIKGFADLLKRKTIAVRFSLQQLQRHDDMNIVTPFFAGESISDSFRTVYHLSTLRKEMSDFLIQKESIEKRLIAEQELAQDNSDDIVKLKKLAYIQKDVLEQKKKDKKTLLERTKGQEKQYQIQLKKSKKDAITIRQQIFTLEGAGISLSLGDAIDKAKFTGEKTGIRPAFLLGIFQVESKLGTYLGRGSWQKDMKPRERNIFLALTKKLGLDPDSMPISKKPWYGWGGAMGPAQFLPSTWMAYEDRITSLTGHTPPSPWHIDDAFMASGLKLVSNGAGSHILNDEHTAAAKYIGGKNYKKRVSQLYAKNVLEWAAYYQEQIDALKS